MYQPQEYQQQPPYGSPLPPVAPQFNQFNTTPFGGSVAGQQPEMGQPAMSLTLPPQKNPTPPPGWNDPPPARARVMSRPSQVSVKIFIFFK